MTSDLLRCLSHHPHPPFFSSLRRSPLCQGFIHLLLSPSPCLSLSLMPSVRSLSWLRSPWLLLRGAESSLTPHVFILQQVTGCNPTLVYIGWGVKAMPQRDGNRPLSSGPGTLGGVRVVVVGKGGGCSLEAVCERECQNSSVSLCQMWDFSRLGSGGAVDFLTTHPNRVLLHSFRHQLTSYHLYHV